MALRLDPRMPEPDACVLRYRLERLAASQPDKVFANFADGTEWTYRQTREIAIRTANAFRKLGVKQGERVLVWLPNSADCLRVWFGLNYLGAVFVPINLAYRGNLLQHTVNVSEARLGVIHADLHQRLGEIEPQPLREIVVLGGPAQAVRGLEVRAADALESGDTNLPDLEREIAPWDLQSIIFTSGTTGPSKGVLSSYVHLYNMAIAAPFLSGEDRYMLNLPLFHSGGVMPTTAMLIHGGSIAMVDAFDTDTFWDTVRRRGITTSILLGVMGGFLLKRPPSADDKNHPLRTCTYVPLNETARQFHERFGTDIYTHFNMTEISQPIVSAANPTALGSAGRPRPGVEVRIVDENDCELGAGRSRRARRAHGLPLGGVAWLRRQCGGDRDRVAQWLVPYRRRLQARRRGQLLFRRPAEGRDPPARREHLVVRGRVRNPRPSRRARSGGGGGEERNRRG